LKNISKLILFILLIVIIGLGVFVVNWKIPAPISKVERVLPDDRFPK
jgi:hypothetical protein